MNSDKLVITDKAEFKESFERVTLALDSLSENVQLLALFSLTQAKKGELKYANELINTVINLGIFEASFLIQWFERFGRLKWNSKKKRLVLANGGTWSLQRAQQKYWLRNRTDKPDKATTARLKQSPQEKIPVRPEQITEDNFSATLQAYIEAYPIDDSPIGKFGKPAGRNRWGDYKMKLRRK